MPFGQHAPAMAHVPAFKVFEHAPVASAQVSVVHENVSAQLELVPHTPAPEHVPQLAGTRSSQRAPVSGLQPVCVVAALQNWHGFATLWTPFA